MREHSDHFISFSARALECIGVDLGRRLQFSPGADIADVALNYLSRSDKVNITDKLDLDMLARPCAERLIFVPDIALFL